jgi:TolB-like protein/DNA-binding winged helix-turn-helix (wHTH) protein/tetratricopeptide (TPR) repeat protein
MEPGTLCDESIGFGPFELRTLSGELLRDGRSVKLSPQPFKVLLLLIRNNGRLVTRKEIREEIWGAETFVDFDKGLNLCIAQIREALGEDAQSPKFIETLPRRGYRFTGEIKTAPADKFPADNLPDKEVSGQEKVVKMAPALIPPVSNRSRRRAIQVGSLATLALIAVIAFSYFRWTRDGTPVNPVRKDGKAMLLVLPFENLTNDPGQEYFSDGLTEEMIARLGALQPKQLGVIARTTALTYKKTGKDIRQIGRELGVDYVLEGSVRRDGGRLRITSQLIRVEDQTHLWGETFDREESDVLDIQEEVAARIASSLRLGLLPSLNKGSLESKSAQPAAFDAYLKGRYLITRDTPEDLQRSIPYFDRAIANDPEFASAYTAQVEALVLLADWTGTIASSDLPKAKSAALKAVELDSSFAEGYAALGSVKFWLEWKVDEAGENFQRAVELNPNNPLTRLNYGRWLLSRGDIDSGAAEMEEALRLDPVSLLTTGLAAYANLNAGRYERAIALSRRMLELEPKSPAARDCLFRAYVNLGDYPAALGLMHEQLILSGADPKSLKRLDDGNPKEIIEARLRQDLSDMNVAMVKGERVWTMYAAWICARLGEKDQAFRWLEKGLDERASFILYLGIDPAWDALRQDLRFAALKGRITSVK